MIGLDEKTQESIRNVFKEFSAIKEARIFGSRVIGNFRPNSDVDIALFGDLNGEVRGRVSAALDALPTPYQFDVVCYLEIQNSDLKDHIDRVGKILYKQ